MVRVLLFASLGELFGETELEFPLTKGSTTNPGEIFAALADRCPALAAPRARVLVAVNQEYAGWDTPVAGGDEVAYFPPVSGGGPWST